MQLHIFKELNTSIIEKKLPNQYTVIVGIVGNDFYYLHRLSIYPDYVNLFQRPIVYKRRFI
jgi:hypothetical protein